MMQDFDYTEFIERYLEGAMSPEEKNWFDKEIEGNSFLKNEISFREQVNSTLADKEIIDLKVQLEQIHKEIFEVTESGKGAIRKVYRRISYTASALVVFTFLMTLYMNNRNFSNERLIEMYYQPAETAANFRTATASEDQLSEAMSYYDNEEYHKAIDLFESMLKEDENRIGLNLYSGISHMEINEYNAANERFQTIINGSPNPFVESANWYMGVCYIMTNEREMAAEKFEDITDDSQGFYYQKAKKVLKRIK